MFDLVLITSTYMYIKNPAFEAGVNLRKYLISPGTYINFIHEEYDYTI